MKRTVTILLVLVVAVLLLAVGSSSWAAQLPHEVVWNESRNQNLWTHGVDKGELAAQVSQPKPTDRGRVQIDPQLKTLIADNGLMIRGEHLRSSALIFDKNDPNSRINIERAMDIDIWTRLVERHNLNTVRYILYRPPQFWTGGPGWDCPVERCFPTVQDALPYIDAAVEMASDMGMYLIIDYHPVLGHSAEDAREWWQVIAPRYKNRTHVIYEVANEPVAGGPSGYDAADIAFEENMYQLIRSLAPETHIILWSFGDYDGATPVVEAADQINYDNASVSYHPYAWHGDVLDRLRNRGYPLIATELGDNLGSPPPDSRGYRWKTERQEAADIAWIWLDGTGWGKPWETRDPVPVTWPRDPKTGRPAVTTPTIEPNGGSHAGSVNVSLSFPDPSMLGAEIRYTLDGSEPTAQSKLYQGPFTINSSTTVKAKGFKHNYNNSSTATAAFTIGAGPTFTPTATGLAPTATGVPPTATPEQTATATPVSGSEELLTNGGFEATFDGWNKNPDHSWVQMRGTSADKQIATWPWNNYVIWQGGLRIVENEQYEACVTLETNTPYSYQVNLRVVDLASNANLGLDEVLNSGENCFGFTAEGSTASGAFVLAFSNLSSPGTRLDFDDASLKHLLPTPTPPPTATATATATPTATPSPTWTPSPSPSPSATVAPEDLLQNGNFDNGFASWNKEPGHSWVQMRGSTADPNIAVWPWNNYRIWQDGLRLTEGAQYKACVEMFTNTGYPFQVVLQVQDGNNNAGLQQQLSRGENCLSFTATRSSENGRFELFFSGLSQPGTRINFDNMRLRRVS